MSAPSKSLIVSLHDVHAATHAQAQEQLNFLAERGVPRASILVVPEFHHRGSVLQDRPFCDAATGWQGAGHELVLHGYFHDRVESPPENMATLFWTRLYTNREAEFIDIPLDVARHRLERGRALFESLGWRLRGFVAPAWLMADGITNLLGDLGFIYTTRLTQIVGLGALAGRVIDSRSLCYSTRAAWRRVGSAFWNKQVFGHLQETDLMRLSLHPNDLEFPLLRRQIDQIVRAALKRGYVPTTYADYVAH